jgi:hypothetical protein
LNQEAIKAQKSAKFSRIPPSATES